MHKLRAFDFERGSRLSTWISMLATNATWDHLRSFARRPGLGPWGEVELTEADDPDPLKALLAREDVARLAKVLDSFSQKDREFVQLFYLGDEDPEHVAVRLRISVKTVYTKKHKLKARLLKALRAHGDRDVRGKAPMRCAQPRRQAA